MQVMLSNTGSVHILKHRNTLTEQQETLFYSKSDWVGFPETQWSLILGGIQKLYRAGPASARGLD